MFLTTLTMHRDCALIVVLLTTLAEGPRFGVVADDNVEAAVRESDVEGRVGESVRLPCEVDKESCGAFHSIKWYKGNDRVFIFSEMAEVKRPEGTLLERTEFHYSEDRRENWLEIFPLHTEDEGKYKCEITYLAVKEACSVVQFVNLKTLARPTSFQISFEDGSLISNGSTIGPFPEGEDLSIRCQAGGAKPVPSVKWFNGSEKIQGRFQSTVDDDGLFVGSNPIQIRLSRYDLKRRLKCEVFNDAMSEPVLLWAEIDVNVAPLKVTTQPHRSVVREGDKVTIHCSAKGAKPMAEITWMNGSVPIEDAQTEVNIQEDTTEVQMEDGTFETESKLTFDGTRFENGVPFSCHATNEVLKRKNLPPLTHNVTIDVQYAPTVLVHPENTTLNETMDFILFCEYDANPIQLTHVYWYLDDHQLDIVGRPDKYRNGNIQHSSLLVVNASAGDMGEYTCRVANDVAASEVTNSAFVNVQYRPEVAVVTEMEGPISEKLEMNLILVCDVIKANPNTLMKVRWYYDGQGLKELPDCDVNGMNGEFCYVDPSRLLLENVTRAFHGNYSCEGMNSAGWGPMSSQTPVIVHHKPNVTAIQYHPNTVIKGQPVTLTCDLFDYGRPAADTFRWTRNSHLVPDKTSQAWRIDSASLETKARYSCVAMNSEGESRPSFIAIDVLAKPTFITRLPQYHGALMNAQEVSLTCRVECSPNCTISWMKDNQNLDNDTHYSVSNVNLPPDPESGDFESVRSTLSWKMSMWPEGHLNREKDNANYTCVSSPNIAGPGVSSHTVFRVEYPPENIKISHEVLQVKENEVPDKIGCSASGYPEPTYRWMYNEETVRTGNLLNFDFPIDRKIAGAYTCIAENRHGEVKASTTLDVMFKPECKIDRQDTGSGDSAGIILICRAYAHPEEVSFRWRMGNETLIDPVVSEGMESKLSIEALPTSLGTYYCYVNNTVGESIPCEIDVTGLLETFGDDNMLLYAIIAGSVIIIIIIIIILIMYCRRQQQRGKYSDTAKKDNAPKSDASGKDSKDNGPNSPEAEGPTFYENLPFHGIQAPPNKIIVEECPNTFMVGSNVGGGSRPPSQLSQQTSSGYGSTRSQKAQSSVPRRQEKVKETKRKNKGDVSFTQDTDQEATSSNFKRRDSQSYGSMKSPSVKVAKGAIARTAAYLSVRMPRKIRPQPSARADESFPIHTEGEENLSMENENLPHSQAPNSNSTFVTSETSHTLNAKRKSANSIIIESTQTSKLTLHSNNPSSESNSGNARTDLPETYSSRVKSQTFQNRNQNIENLCQNLKDENQNSNNKNPFNNAGRGSFATLHKEGNIKDSESNMSEIDVTPTPAPRNGCSQAKPTYQNIPTPKKLHKKDLTQTPEINECQISQPHDLHVLSNENRRKLNYELPCSKNPSTNGYSAANSSSSNASSPSSAQYQQPYQNPYPPQNYQSNSPPNFNHYPPIYSQPSRYHHSPSSYPAADRQYSGDYSKSSNSVQSHTIYPPPQGVSYKDHHINHNGLPNNYRDYESEYNALQFNNPVIGQEIDV